MTTHKPEPAISVILPVFNAAEYLRASIDSILGQTYPDFELIVINDGSTDNSAGIIASYSDSRLISLSNTVNSGLVHSLNYGLSQATGKYIARMDADDIAFPDRLKIQFDFLEKNQSYGMCGTFYEIIDHQGKKIHKVELPQADKDLKTYLNFGNCFCHSTIMFRASLLTRFQYEEQYFLIEDYKLWYHFSRISQVAIIPAYTLQYRVHSNNISTRKRDQMLALLQEMNKTILHSLNIAFSDRELSIHTHFLAFNYSFFKTAKDIDELESWVLKIYNQTGREPGMSKRVLTRVLLRRWFVVCFRTKSYNSLLFSRLTGTFKWNYARLLIEKITGSLFKDNLGIDY